MSRPRHVESSRTARVSAPRHITLAVALLTLAVIAVTPRPARAAFRTSCTA